MYVTLFVTLFTESGRIYRYETCIIDQQGFWDRSINPLMATLKPQSNGPLDLYSNTVIGTLAVDG